jgi:hypothetical protein
VLLPADFDEIENEEQEDNRIGSASNVETSSQAAYAAPSAGA